MKYITILFLLFLTACKSTIPSESIAQGVINDLNAHQQAIQVLDKQTTKECKTDAFLASLNALKQQTDSIAGQVKSINQACQTEKRVLERDITIREIIIAILFGLFVFVGYLLIRRK